MKSASLIAAMLVLNLFSGSAFGVNKHKEAIKALDDLDGVSVVMAQIEPAEKALRIQRAEEVVIRGNSIEDSEYLRKIFFLLSCLENQNRIDLTFRSMRPHFFEVLGRSSHIINGFKSTRMSSNKKMLTSDAEIVQLARIKNLRHFSYVFSEKSQITEKGIKGLSQHSNLINLSMANLNLPDTELTSLKSLNKLKVITFWGRNSITGEIFSDLSKETITHIYIEGDLNDDDMLEHLKDYKNLEQLIIQGPITGRKLHLLENLRKLNSLSLTHSKVKGKPLASIRNIKSLKKLYLNNCPVSDSDIPYLKKLGHLEEIGLRHTEVSPDGVKKLKSILVNTKIRHHSAAGDVEPF